MFANNAERSCIEWDNNNSLCKAPQIQDNTLAILQRDFIFTLQTYIYRVKKQIIHHNMHCKKFDKILVWNQFRP